MGFIFAIAAAVTWGIVYTIDQKILTNISPAALVFLDAIITIIIMAPFALFEEHSVRTVLQSGKSNLYLMTASVALAVLANFFIFSSIKRLGATEASIFEIAYPVFVALFGVFVFHNRLNAYFLLGAFMILVGSAIIIRFA